MGVTKVEFNRFTRSANKICGISATDSKLIKVVSKTLGKSVNLTIQLIEALSLLHYEQAHLNWDGVAFDLCE
jgi:hypothetical protein